jgi:hypothetical protein
MPRTILTAAVLSTLALGADAPGPKCLFQDPFDRGLHESWTFLRENPDSWRIYRHALEIRVEPGDAGSVKNALVRPAPDRTKGKFAVEVTVTNTATPTHQYEQGGITWYIDGKPAYKLVKEWIDGKLWVVSSIGGRAQEDAMTVGFRLVVDGTDFIAQYRPEGKGEFKVAATGKLPPPGAGKEEVSIQCYQGPADAEHWIRLDDFRILDLGAK